MRILHFADAHIDIAAHGRHDPETGLPVRVLDFLTALDTIVDTAINEKVDLVLFAGDAYKDRSPAPTFQREWGRRIMRLARAGVPVLLLVGNHDISPAAGRANAMQEFDTLEVPNVRLLGKPGFIGPDELFGLPLQVLALPWISRSGMMAALEMNGIEPGEIYAELETRLAELVQHWLENCRTDLPVVLTAHCSVQGAVYGGERSVMLGSDLVLSGAIVKDPRLSYVALGHIHKAQDLNKDGHHPVVYPGSIERVDFGEAHDDKFFVIAEVNPGQPTKVEWRKLNGRRFIDLSAVIETAENVMGQIFARIPPAEQLENALVRLTLDYPRDWEDLIDEPALRQYARAAFEFHLVRRPRLETRLRLPADRSITSLTPLDLLEIYWKTMKTPSDDIAELQRLAQAIIQQPDEPDS